MRVQRKGMKTKDKREYSWGGVALGDREGPQSI